MTLKLTGDLTLDNGTRAQSIAGVAPTLDYRFARDRREIETVSLSDKLTYTGGNGTFVGSDGYIQRATTNAPRFDHDPVSRVSEGLLVEAERTNSIRNNTMVGAVAGSPGTLPTSWAISAGAGLTASVAATGTENGINYVDIKISGTTTGIVNTDIVPETYVAALTGQAWTQSVYYKLVSGSLSNVSQFSFRFNEWTSGLVFISGQSSAALQTPTANNLATQRVNSSVTLSGGATTAFLLAFLRITCTTGSVDFTLRIGLPQLEQGATASTPIPTTTAAVTRTADSAVIDGTGVLTGTYTMVEKPAGCAQVSGSNIVLQAGYTAERVMVFPAALSGDQITAIREAM